MSMKNELSHAEEQASERIAAVERQKLIAERRQQSWRSKFQREQELRRNAEAELGEADARCTAALRAQDEQLRSNNVEIRRKAQLAAKRAEQVERQTVRHAIALEHERNRAKFERELRERLEEKARLQEYRHTEQLRAQDELLRSNNARTLRKAHEAVKRTTQAERQAVRNAKALQQERNRARDERELRERMEEKARLQEQRLTEQLRARDEHMRSNNQKLLSMQQLLESQVQQLNQQLQRANSLKEVQVAQSLTQELALVKDKLAKANSMNASLRRNQDAKQISQLQANLQTMEKAAEEMAKGVEARDALLTFLESEHEKALKDAQREQAEYRRRQQRTHAQALRRGREKQKHMIDLKHEVRMKGQTIDALVAKLAAEIEHSLLREDLMKKQIRELRGRVELGDSRITQLQQEASWLINGIEQIEKEAVESQQRIESTLRSTEEELNEYRTFQAKDKGAYKECVRMCYYKLIDLKVPTNQLKPVVEAVLNMMGSRAKNLPSRGSAQNMRREMGHWGDTVAGVELATAHNVTGASDDTTKLQKKIAADLAHFRLPDGSLRTLCIGLSCLSNGTAAAKVQRYSDKLAQVQAAARLSVPTFHGDVAAFDRVTLLDLVKNWCSDRCITERNAATMVEERKGKEARAREGARQLAYLRSASCRMDLTLQTNGGEVFVCVILFANKHPYATHLHALESS